jgi:hypothetical protein
VMLKIVLFFSIWFLWMEAGCLRLFNKVLVLNINISCCNDHQVLVPDCCHRFLDTTSMLNKVYSKQGCRLA